MHFRSARSAALLLSILTTGCLGLDLEPSVGGVLQSVVSEGEALQEFSEAVGGNGTMRVSGFIVGRLRCDTVEGDVQENGGNLRLTITVVTGRQGCNSLTPTTLSYAANLFNLDPGQTGILVEHRYQGLEGVPGVRLDSVVVVG